MVPGYLAYTIGSKRVFLTEKAVLLQIFTSTVAVEETVPMVASCGAVTPDVTATRVAVETRGGVIVAICCGRWVTVAADVTAAWSVFWAC